MTTLREAMLQIEADYDISAERVDNIIGLLGLDPDGYTGQVSEWKDRYLAAKAELRETAGRLRVLEANIQVHMLALQRLEDTFAALVADHQTETPTRPGGLEDDLPKGSAD